MMRGRHFGFSRGPRVVVVGFSFAVDIDDFYTRCRDSTDCGFIFFSACVFVVVRFPTHVSTI